MSKKIRDLMKPNMYPLTRYISGWTLPPGTTILEKVQIVCVVIFWMHKSEFIRKLTLRVFEEHYQNIRFEKLEEYADAVNAAGKWGQQPIEARYQNLLTTEFLDLATDLVEKAVSQEEVEDVVAVKLFHEYFA